MADEQKTEDQDETQDDEQQEGTGKGDDARGDDADKPGAALLKALNTEREAKEAAERELRALKRKDRETEQARAIKAGEFDSVLKAKDTELAEKDARIAELEGEIASSRLETVRERVAAKHKLPAELAARLRGSDEASLDADAKALAKLIVVKAPDTEAGKGNGQGGGKVSQEELVQRMVASGKWNI